MVRRRFRQQRLIPAFMEPRSVVVDPTAAQLTMWSATQIPHILGACGAHPGHPGTQLRVIAPDVGGGFGGKLAVIPEEIHRAAGRPQARQAGEVDRDPLRVDDGRPPRAGSDPGHHASARSRDGTVTGLKVELLADMGAYLGLVGPGVPILGAFMFNSIYKFPAYRFTCTNVFTNTMVTDAYRGAGRPEATYAIERIMDELAVELGMDPMELRKKNWINHEEFPYTTVATLTYDSGNYEAATEKAMELFDYDGPTSRNSGNAGNAGDVVQLGIGISTYTEMCGLAPSRVLGSLDYGAGGWEHAAIRVLPTGKVEVVTGSSAHGQGHETAWSQIVADQLGVPFEDVEVLHGDTQSSHKGLDTYGSRSLVVGGVAVVKAAEKVVAKARKIAAHMMECARGRHRVLQWCVQGQGH